MTGFIPPKVASLRARRQSLFLGPDGIRCMRMLSGEYWWRISGSWRLHDAILNLADGQLHMPPLVQLSVIADRTSMIFEHCSQKHDASTPNLWGGSLPENRATNRHGCHVCSRDAKPRLLTLSFDWRNVHFRCQVNISARLTLPRVSKHLSR